MRTLTQSIICHLLRSAQYLPDKFKGKTVLQTVEAFSLLSSLIMVFFLFLDLNIFWIAYIAAFFLGIRFPLLFPSFRILIREAVKKENLTNAIALETGSFQLGKILGPIEQRKIHSTCGLAHFHGQPPASY